MDHESTQSRLKEALANAEHSLVDKATQIKAFLASQSRYSGNYSAKGSKDGAKRLNQQATTESSRKITSKQPEHFSTGHGFSSPVLKPRNENSKLVPACAKPRTDRSDHMSTIDLSKETRDSKFSGKVPKSKLPAQSYEAHPGVQSEVKESRGKAKEKLPHEKQTARQEKKKRRRCVSSDSERSGILAQRRERRRQKKEKMQEREEDQHKPSDEKLEKAKVPQSKTARNLKGSQNLPAGLALMHGFSAKNVGKQRITLEPPPFIGVFNKGRASGKQTVAAKKKGTTLFNESSFLGNKVSSNKKKPKAQDRSDLAESPVARPTQSETSLATTGNDNATNTRSSPRQLHGYHSRTTEPSSPVSAKSHCSNDRAREESEIWEIEKEFLEQNHEKALDEGTTLGKPESILVDSRNWDWNENDGNECPINPHERTIKTRQRTRHTSSVATRQRNSTLSSIGPSQSASQVRPIPSVLVASMHFLASNDFEKDLDVQPKPEQATSGLRKGSDVNEESVPGDRMCGALEADEPSSVGSFPSESRQLTVSRSLDRSISIKQNQSSDGFQSLEAAINELEQEDINTVLHFSGGNETSPFCRATKTVRLKSVESDVDATPRIYEDKGTRFASGEGPVSDLYGRYFGELAGRMDGTEDIIDGLLCEDSALGVDRLDDTQPDFCWANDACESDGILHAYGSRLDDAFVFADVPEQDSVNDASYERDAVSDDRSELCLTSDISNYTQSSPLLFAETLCLESDGDFEDRATTDLRFEDELATLADAEAAVAAMFRNRWYPVKH